MAEFSCKHAAFVSEPGTESTRREVPMARPATKGNEELARGEDTANRLRVEAGFSRERIPQLSLEIPRSVERLFRARSGGPPRPRQIGVSRLQKNPMCIRLSLTR